MADDGLHNWLTKKGRLPKETVDRLLNIATEYPWTWRTVFGVYWLFQIAFGAAISIFAMLFIAAAIDLDHDTTRHLIVVFLIMSVSRNIRKAWRMYRYLRLSGLP